MKEDVYEVCRFIRHYHAKNGYAPRVVELHVSGEYVKLLEEHGIIEILPIYANGPKVGVCLTEKGTRLAVCERRRR